jgi:hypothetical protein
MALINCPECNKEISDKAENCPGCGFPVNKKTESSNDEYLCCPKCFSKDLHTEQKGFSGGKALAGALLTGGIGLLAGTIGSKDVQITCLKCGLKFKAGEARIHKKDDNEEIDGELKRMIESGNMLAATKYYSIIARCDLADAKKYLDSYAERHGIRPSNKAGCAGVLLLLIITASSLIFIL